GKPFGQQTVAAQRAAFADCQSLQRLQELDGMHDLRLKFAEQRPVLAQFALAYHGKHGDGGVFPVFLAARAEHLARAELVGPGSSQSLDGLFIEAEVARGLEKEVAVNYPQPAVTGRPHLEGELAVL